MLTDAELAARTDRAVDTAVSVTVTVDGVPFVEVSLGYPREWRRHSERVGGHFPDLLPRTVLPAS